MDKALTFFRVFDLAFFAPGTILLIVGWYKWAPASARQADLSATEGLIAFLSFVATAFCIGLIVHAVVWAFLKPILVHGVSDGGKDWTPFPDHFKDDIRVDLILYFWYLRATSWNVAFALGVSAILALCSPKWGPMWIRCIVFLAVAFGGAMLCRLGRGYHRILQKSLGIIEAYAESEK